MYMYNKQYFYLWQNWHLREFVAVSILFLLTAKNAEIEDESSISSDLKQLHVNNILYSEYLSGGFQPVTIFNNLSKFRCSSVAT